MLYLGLDKIYDLPHHTIFFAGDYQQNISDIFQSKVLSEDISFYVRNASVTDPGARAARPFGDLRARARAEPDGANRLGRRRERPSATGSSTAMETRAGMTDLPAAHPRGNRLHAADLAGA